MNLNGIDEDAASAEIQQVFLRRSGRSSLAPPRISRAASPSTELVNSLTHSLHNTSLRSPIVSPRLDRKLSRLLSEEGIDSMEEGDVLCQLYDGPQALPSDDEGCYEQSWSCPVPQRRATTTSRGPLGPRSRSEDVLAMSALAHSDGDLQHSSPISFDAQLSNIPRLAPEHIRHKLRSNSITRDDSTLCLQNEALDAFEQNKENAFIMAASGGGRGGTDRHHRSPLALPGDGSSAGTMRVVGIPRPQLRDRSPSTRRVKSVPVRVPDQSQSANNNPGLNGPGDFDPHVPFASSSSVPCFAPPSSSSSSASSPMMEQSPVRVSSLSAIPFTARSTDSFPARPRSQHLSVSLQNSPNLARRSDASAFHSPARQGGSKSRRPVRSLAQSQTQTHGSQCLPLPARPPSTPPILPSFSADLIGMAPFSKSEPVLPSSSCFNLSLSGEIVPRQLEMGPDASMPMPSTIPMPSIPASANSLRMRSISLSNLHSWSEDGGRQAGTFPVRPRRMPRLSSDDEEESLDDETEDVVEEDESGLRASVRLELAMQKAKRKRSKNTKLARMARSCSSLSDMSEIYHSPVLPVVPDKSLLPAISAETAMKVLAGQYSEHFSEVVVVDCRYPYEFEGGHIEGAINLPRLESIEERFPVSRDLPDRDRTIIIFHCEFSSKRGPEGVRHLRKLDRQANIDRHPNTCYPHVYLLHGGYKEFFERSKAEYCSPPLYRTMSDPDFKDDLQKWSSLVKDDAKKRIWKKQKSQSFACLSSITGRIV